MADRKYLAVYGKGATEVVGRVVTVWRNEDSTDNGYRSLSIQRPKQGERKWSRHLALQDLAGGLNYIGPYPDSGLGSLCFRDIMAAVPETAAQALLKDADEGCLHVLNHITGETPSIKRIDLIPMTPNIEKQLEYGEKTTGIIKRTEPGRIYSDTKWEWNQDKLPQDNGKVLPDGIRAVVPADDPIIPIIITEAKEEKGAIRIEGINPLEWKKESFRMTDVPQLRAELETLRNTPGSIRMFRPRKYWKGLLNEAEIIHASIKDEKSKKVSMDRLKNNYDTAINRLQQYRDGGYKVSNTGAIQLQLAGAIFFRAEGFKETVLLAEKILQFVNDKQGVESLKSVMDDINTKLSEQVLLCSAAATVDILERIEDVMSRPALRNVRFGEVDVESLKPLSPEAGISHRCRALLGALKEYGGNLCAVDDEKKAIVWKIEGSTFEKPEPVRPKDDGMAVLPALAKKHLDALADKNFGHMYQATRDCLLVLSANHEEGAEATAKRLAGEVGINEDYLTPDDRGRIKIPLYRSGYTRRLPHSDVMVQVSPTIADTWVLPTTARKYYLGLMKEIENKTDTDVSPKDPKGIGADVAELTRRLLDATEGKPFEERLSKLGQIAADISDKDRSPKNEVRTVRSRDTGDPRG